MRAALVSVWVFLAGCQGESTVSRLVEQVQKDSGRPMLDPAMRLHRQNMSPRLLRRFAPIRIVDQQEDVELVTLGRLLFFDPRLSRTGSVSCNSCHPLDRFGTTASTVSVGVDGKLGRRNAPTVYNAAGHFREFWDGRAATLEEQAAGPLMNPSEMGMTPAKVLQKLRQIPGYRAAFARAFPQEPTPISMTDLTKALAAFERGLNTPARWDRYLEGDVTALTQLEKDGARLFANLGCLSCHTGAYIGGAMYSKAGLVHPWPNQSDRGRFEVTKNPADEFVFKVPSLRNVAHTAPYFHDGSAETLDAAVRKMAFHQLGLDLKEVESTAIVAWLKSLTGQIPEAYIKPPDLPRADAS
jgi:cytochrome c peroxidase